MKRGIVIAACLAATIRVADGQRGASSTPPDAAPRFTNLAPADGLDFRHVNGGTPDRHLLEIMGSGGLFFDYDEDGWVDVFLVDGGSLVDARVDATARDRLFRNRGDGMFQDVSASAGIVHAAYGMGACAADYDNDGWTDLYVTSVGPNRLYHNDGGTRFSDVTARAGVSGSPVFSTSCAFLDADRDGDVDLFVVNYVDARIDNNTYCGDTAKKIRIYCHPLNFAPLQNVLYRNNGNGTFSDVSREAGISRATGSVWSAATTTTMGWRISSWPTTRRRISCFTTRGAACSGKWRCSRAWRSPPTGGRAPAWARTSAITTATATSTSS